MVNSLILVLRKNKLELPWLNILNVYICIMAEISHIIFFDGKCNLCNHTVDFIIRWKKRDNIFFASLQSDFAESFLGKRNVFIDSSTIYYYRKGKLYDRSTAILLIARQLRGIYSSMVVLWIIPKFLRDFVYKLVAKNRYSWFGKRDTCRIPLESELSFFLEQKEDLVNHRFI